MKRFAFATVSLIMVASSCSKVEVGTGFSPLETSYVIEVISSDKRTPLVLASAESGEFEYSSPVIQQIRMNWGYANEYLNDNLYTLTGDWTIVVNGENRAYNYRRELIYGFSNMQ